MVYLNFTFEQNEDTHFMAVSINIFKEDNEKTNFKQTQENRTI